MIDIHSHILPGFDDGVRETKESIQLGLEYQKCGFRSVIATPHIKDGQYNHRRNEIVEAVDALNIECACAGLNLDVFAGAEYAMDIRILKDFEKDEIITLAHSRHVLLEFPYYHVPKYAQTIVSLLVKNDFIPVLAHPERCRDICTRDAEQIAWYVDKGCIIQVDAQSLTGGNGRSSMKTGWKFINDDIVDIISLDAHRVIPLNRTFQSLEKLIKGAGKTGLKPYFDKAGDFISRQNLKVQK